MRETSLVQTNSRRKKFKLTEGFYGTLFASIPLIGLLLFTFIPVVASFITIFFDMRGFEIDSMTWNSFQTFKDVFADKVFLKSILRSAYATVAQFVSLIIALIMATLLHQKIGGHKIFKILYFMPYICSTVATAVMWKWMFNPEYGVINDALAKMFGEGARINWTQDSKWFMPMIIIVISWNAPGYGIVFISAALQSVNKSYYEASSIDGASKLTQFFKITLPAISPSLFFLIMTGIINGMQTFDVINIFAPSVQGLGGGPKQAGVTTVFYIFHTLNANNNMPAASLMTWVLFAIIAVISIVNFKLSNKWVSYD